VSNAGTLEGAGSRLTVNGDVASSGLLLADNGALKITGAVTGTGVAKLFGTGRLEVDGAFGQNVDFLIGCTGQLVLGDSQAFGGTITGFSNTGANSLDLKDIASSPEPPRRPSPRLQATSRPSACSPSPTGPTPPRSS